MIYFKDGKEATTLLQLFKLGFNAGNNFVETYTDSDCSLIQCKDMSRRSFSDLVEIAQTYFPDTTEKEVMDALEEMGAYGLFCDTAGKITFRKNLDQGLTFPYDLYSDSPYKKHQENREGEDGWSFILLKQLLNNE